MIIIIFNFSCKSESECHKTATNISKNSCIQILTTPIFDNLSEMERREVITIGQSFCLLELITLNRQKKKCETF